jgi:hypothetical protein
VIESINNGETRFPFPYETSSWQPVFIKLFRKLGEESGYTVFGDMEWFKIDCPWILDLPKHRIVELLMEHQDDDKLDSAIHDIRKLGDIKAHIKVIIYFPDLKEINDHLKRISVEIQRANDEIKQVPSEKWLVIGIKNMPKGKITFHGYEFSSDGLCTQVGNVEFDENSVRN